MSKYTLEVTSEMVSDEEAADQNRVALGWTIPCLPLTTGEMEFTLLLEILPLLLPVRWAAA